MLVVLYLIYFPQFTLQIAFRHPRIHPKSPPQLRFCREAQCTMEPGHGMPYRGSNLISFLITVHFAGWY